MTRKLKKVLALLLTLSMVMSMVTVGAMAKGEGRYCTDCAQYEVYYVDQVNPTCQEKGIIAHYSCRNCSCNFYELETTKTLVRYGKPVPRIDTVPCDYSISATCMSNATCKWCGAEDPNGSHDPNNHAEGCTLGDWIITDGEHYKEYSRCKLQVERTGHVAIGVPAVPATCLAAGTTAGTKCSTCGVILSGVQEDPTKEHSYTGDYVVQGDAGHAQKCVNGCDGLGRTVEHSGEWVETTPATCTAKGEETQTCVCGHVTTRETDMLDHKDEDHDNFCDDCGAKICDHAWDEGEQTKAPNYKEAGEMKYTCSKCGATKTEPVAKLVCNHDHEGDRQYEDLGNETHKITCKTCDEVLMASEAHTFDENGACVCGAEAVAQVGENLFTTLGAAVTAAIDGDTVKVLKSVSETVVVRADKDIALDLNGQTVFNGSYDITIQNQGVLTIQDSSEEQTGKVVSNGNDDAIDNYGTLNVEAGTIQGGTAWYGIYAGANSTTNVYGTAKVTGEYWGIAAGNGSETAKINVYGNAEITSRNPAGTNGGISASKAETKVYGNAKVTGPCGINTNGSLTISGNATIEAKHENAGTAIGLYTGADVKVEGGTIKGGAYGISGNGTSDDTAVMISGGTISGIGAGIYHPQAGTLTITGGEITGGVGVQMCDGALNISGKDTKITGTDEDESGTKTGDGVIIDGAAVSLVKRGGYGTPVANIEDGLFASRQAKAVVTYGWSNTTPGKMEWFPEKFISGGYFSNDVTNTEKTVYVADDYASHPVSTYEGYFHVHQPGTPEDWSYDDDGHWKTCSGHNDCLVTVSEKADHVWDAGVVTTQPTYDAEGVRTFTCDTCGHTRTEPIPMLDRPTTPSITYYTLTISYVDGEGNAVADTYTRDLREGRSYSVTSPAVEGMTPDQATVSGVLNGNTTITVTYAEDVEEPDTPTTESPDPTESPEESEDLGENDTPLTETPETSEPPVEPTETPEPTEPQNPDEGEDLSENDTPLADVPQTGDFLWVWLTLALLSAAGLVWVSLTEKKGKRVA